jgi:hypothetical protein
MKLISLLSVAALTGVLAAPAAEPPAATDIIKRSGPFAITYWQNIYYSGYGAEVATMESGQCG